MFITNLYWDKFASIFDLPLIIPSMTKCIKCNSNLMKVDYTGQDAVFSCSHCSWSGCSIDLVAEVVQVPVFQAIEWMTSKVLFSDNGVAAKKYMDRLLEIRKFVSDSKTNTESSSYLEFLRASLGARSSVNNWQKYIGNYVHVCQLSAVKNYCANAWKYDVTKNCRPSVATKDLCLAVPMYAGAGCLTGWMVKKRTEFLPLYLSANMYGKEVGLGYCQSYKGNNKMVATDDFNSYLTLTMKYIDKMSSASPYVLFDGDMNSIANTNWRVLPKKLAFWSPNNSASCFAAAAKLDADMSTLVATTNAHEVWFSAVQKSMKPWYICLSKYLLESTPGATELLLKTFLTQGITPMDLIKLTPDTLAKEKLYEYLVTDNSLNASSVQIGDDFFMVSSNSVYWRRVDKSKWVRLTNFFIRVDRSYENAVGDTVDGAVLTAKDTYLFQKELWLSHEHIIFRKKIQQIYRSLRIRNHIPYIAPAVKQFDMFKVFKRLSPSVAETHR